MKKKIGPLPMWTWIVIVGGTIGIYLLYRHSSSSSTSSTGVSANTVDPSSPTGLTYAQESQDQALGIDPLTGETYAQEQAASAATDTSGSTGGGGDTGTTSTTGDPVADSELSTIDGDLQTLNSNLAGGGVTDSQTPAQTFAGEISDVTAGITGLKALQAALAPTPATVKKQPALTVKGALRAASGPTKPAAKKGYTIKGLGNGNWEYVPVVRTVVKNTTKPPATKSHTQAKSTVVSGKKRKGP